MRTYAPSDHILVKSKVFYFNLAALFKVLGLVHFGFLFFSKNRMRGRESEPTKATTEAADA